MVWKGGDMEVWFEFDLLGNDYSGFSVMGTLVMSYAEFSSKKKENWLLIPYNPSMENIIASLKLFRQLKLYI